jgi:signal transduction histidine kinase/DNA-binding response OmpR family regulator/ligand-binding sensor domain-containing protein
LIFILANLWRVSFAQPALGYEVISIAQGLSQGMVFATLQDQEGFIWIATKNGLNRYDGYSFKVFTNDPYNENSLSSNTITALYEDSKGHIWAGTENAGLNVYDKKSALFFRIANRAGDGSSLSGNRIRNSIVETNDGKMLVPAQDAGFNVITLPENFVEKKSTPVIQRLSLPNNDQVHGIGKDKAGAIWISSFNNKVYRFDPANNTFVLFDNNRFYNSGYATGDGGIWINSNFFLSDGANVIPLFDTVKIKPGNLVLNLKPEPWIDFHEELFYYDISKWQPGKPPRWGVDLPITKSSKILFPFLIDRSGMLWTGTKGYGLRKYNLAQSRFSQQVSGFSVRYIVPSDSEILLGAYPYEWRRLVRDSIERNVFERILPGNTIDNVIVSKSGEYWIRTDDEGLFRYNRKTGKLSALPSVLFDAGQGDKQPMLEDRDGYIWFPALGGKFTRINSATGETDSFSINTNRTKPMLTKALCTALYEDGNGVFWIGTEQGFAILDFKNDNTNLPEITWYSNNATNRNSLNYNHVSCFLDDPIEPEKFIWIGTKGGGLNRLDKNSGDFFHLTTKDGLPNDVVYGILPDSSGNIWGSTNKGIFCLVHPDSKTVTNWQFRNFTKTDGLQDDEFNTGAYAILANGNLAFGGVNGLNIFNPAQVLMAGFSPDVFITDIMINNQLLSAGDKTGVLRESIEQTEHITLTWLQDILTLEFSSLDFTAPTQNKYRYQLAGVDKDWVESGHRRSATYLHLPPGNYVFRVQGTNSQGVWSNKIRELRINVLPPWWRTWWAYLCYGILLSLGIWAYFRFTLNRAKLRAQLSFEKLEARRVKEMDTVRTQLYTNITHEFRTPLTIILGMAQQVINKPSEYFDSGMDMIIRNGKNLLKLVNDMLDLSKLETGKMSLQLRNGDMINFLRYIVESFQSLAESQDKQLHFLSDMDTLHLAYDPEKVRQIVSNLLSNALKFTPEKGNIYISVNEQTPKAEAGKTCLVIRVKDTGIGIPESQMQHIFDRFYQLENSTGKAEGTGIGLAITKELVKLMDGEIIVKSPPSGSTKGTEFTVSLLLTRIPETGEDETSPVPDNKHYEKTSAASETKLLISDRQDPAKPLVLLVEDNADVVAYTASCLPDYRLAVGKDGREGVEIAKEIIPDLIITDVMMPFVDGFELCEQLRKDELTSHIPIIMLTAKADIESKLEGLNKGADAYLEKPFNKDELLIRVSKLLELRKNLQQTYLKKTGLITSTPLTPAITRTEEIVASKEDEFVKKVREVIERHLDDVDFTVEQLCKTIFMSHSQLHRKLDALTGCSPNKFIRIIRFNKARELLLDPSNSIASVALDCGYSDPGYFARIFKQEHGATPQEWRTNNKMPRLN